MWSEEMRPLRMAGLANGAVDLFRGRGRTSGATLVCAPITSEDTRLPDAKTGLRRSRSSSLAGRRDGDGVEGVGEMSILWTHKESWRCQYALRAPGSTTSSRGLAHPHDESRRRERRAILRATNTNFSVKALQNFLGPSYIVRSQRVRHGGSHFRSWDTRRLVGDSTFCSSDEVFSAFCPHIVLQQFDNSLKSEATPPVLLI